MFTYIKKSVPGYYVVLSSKLEPELYGDLSDSFDGFLNGCWVLLSSEQVRFHQDHPEATVKEVWDMKLDEKVMPERTLEQAKREKIAEITMYDLSDAVNSFTINKTIKAWFTPDQRSDYNLSIQSAETKGIETLKFVVGNNVLQIPTVLAKVMLAEVQLYANEAYMVTAEHKLAVESLDTIEAVDSYQFDQGYPEKLNFDLV